MTMERVTFGLQPRIRIHTLCSKISWRSGSWFSIGTLQYSTSRLCQCLCSNFCYFLTWFWSVPRNESAIWLENSWVDYLSSICLFNMNAIPLCYSAIQSLVIFSGFCEHVYKFRLYSWLFLLSFPLTEKTSYPNSIFFLSLSLFNVMLWPWITFAILIIV